MLRLGIQTIRDAIPKLEAMFEAVDRLGTAAGRSPDGRISNSEIDAWYSNQDIDPAWKKTEVTWILHNVVWETKQRTGSNYAPKLADIKATLADYMQAMERANGDGDAWVSRDEQWALALRNPAPVHLVDAARALRSVDPADLAAPPTPVRARFSENVLVAVMSEYGVNDRQALLDKAMEYDADQNRYLKASELRAAAAALTTTR